MTEPRATLPDPPTVELETVSESRFGEGGFLVLRRMQVVSIRGGERSAPFPYDLIDRRSVDASVMLAHHRAEGRVWVWLRSAMRPPLALRADGAKHPAVIWEIPAGLIEPNESPRLAAVRELAEELGFHVDEAAMVPLGAPMFPAPGFIGEVHHLFHVEVDPKTRREPDGDGSLVEEGAEVICIPLDEALAACRRGDLRDEKTELGIRRLADVLLTASTP